MDSMLQISLNSHSVVVGNLITATIKFNDAHKFQQVQIEILNVGVVNRSSILSFANKPRRVGDGLVEVAIDTAHLPAGVYEIGLMTFHTSTDGEINPRRDFQSILDFDRKVFEVIDDAIKYRDPEKILEEVIENEKKLEEKFLETKDIRVNTDEDFSIYCVVVFIKNLLIGSRMRFDHFEFLPTGRGLGFGEEFEFVNSYLATQTSTAIQFNYGDAQREQFENNNPVCVVHFPNIAANNVEAVQQYCEDVAGKLLLVLSLVRNARGRIFEMVVIDRTKSKPPNFLATKLSFSRSYYGNLLSGPLAGEHFTSVEMYLQGLDNFNAFLVKLYMQSRDEVYRDFEFIRLWQILEILADSKNYNQDDPLLDSLGNPMFENSKPLVTSNKGANLVFRFLTEDGQGDSTKTLDNVRVWLGLRNAVAHFGAVSEYGKLRNPTDQKWAKVAVNALNNFGTEHYLRELRETVKLVLMKRLVCATSISLVAQERMD